MPKRIFIIDGQGGGIGGTLFKYIKEAYGETVELIGLCTNAITITWANSMLGEVTPGWPRPLFPVWPKRSSFPCPTKELRWWES